MDYKFEISEQPVRQVLSIRTTTSMEKLPGVLGQSYMAIIGYLNEMGEQPADAPFTCYYNMDMHNLDVEMGFVTARPLPGKDNIQAGEIPAGKEVSYLFKGPYHEMEPAYNAMAQWVKQNGHTPTGTAYEFYYNSPQEVPESELLTKIVFPLK